MYFVFYKQLNQMDCGPTCIRMVSKFYGKHYNAATLRQYAGFNRSGVSLLGLSYTAEKIGFRTRGVRLTFEQLLKDVPLPCILHWDLNHFVVLVSIKNNSIKIANPASNNIIRYTKKEFLGHWQSGYSELAKERVGIALLLTPTPDFYISTGEKSGKLNWSRAFQYIKPHYKTLLRVFTALSVSSALQLLFPFFSQNVVDKGINGKNVSFILVLLVAQLVLSLIMTFIDFIRSRMMIRISNSINLSVLADFWIKLTKIPISYYETHSTGDTLQRIGDNSQIQGFITGTALNTIFSLFNFFVYTIILIWYSPILFVVFAIGSAIYFGWIQIFQGFRRKFNNEGFVLSSIANSNTLQLIQGMPDIKLNGAERKMRWQWENIKAQQFKLGIKRMNYGQLQQTGAMVINQIKIIVTTFFVATMVVDGRLSFGEMFAIQYIIGQVNSPLGQIVGFIQNMQDAKISMERLSEIHDTEDEDSQEKHYIENLPTDKSLYFKNVTFSYPGTIDEVVLDNINLTIPEGKITAIVGMSGSGKTTMLRLLLRFYESYKGEIKIGENSLKNFRTSHWRNISGSVMQDGFIFNSTIGENIALGEEEIDYNRLIESCQVANILSLIESLPNGFYTKLGQDGTSVSQGQKQRILIARAIYKNPEYIFFDEATNALDANNEKAIVENLEAFFKDRTVVIVAHRLSTVRNADKIIVLENGKIIEEGFHKSLIEKKGKYFELVKNQLELGN